MECRTLSACFKNTFNRNGNKKAITFLRNGLIETELTYTELDQDANRMANTFLGLGVEKGDRVIFYLDKSLTFVPAHLGLQKIGAIGVPLNPGFKKSEMAYLLQDAEPRLVIAGNAQDEIIKEIDTHVKTLVIETDRPYQNQEFFRSASSEQPEIELKPEDPGVIVYTSGTTGKPKGAVLTQGNLVHDAKNVIRAWEITASDVLCHALPLFHVHGLCFALHTALMAGTRILMFDAFTPETVINVLSRSEGDHACTTFMAVPSMYSKMTACLKEKHMDFSHMRLWTSGSAPLLVQDFQKIKDVFGKEPVEREGMSETGMNFSNPLQGDRKPGSIGLPLPGLEVRVVDPETFQDVAPGQTGEFWLKGPAISPGYWRKPEETAETFVDGWFRTGDLGRVDEDGYYFLTDRIKHIIISGGENVSPKEVESVINQLDGVSESSVVGLADENWGEKVVAAIVPKSNVHLDRDEIQAFCKKHLHNWKCPKDVAFVKELPKNAMGKVLKEEVKKLFQL